MNYNIFSSKVDALKLWLMWKARGDEGLAQFIDNAMDVSQYLKDKITKRPGFEVINNAKEMTNVCFHYIPQSMRDKERTEEWWNIISKVCVHHL